MRIALLGDRSTQPSHLELDALIPRLRDELGARAEWVATDSGFDLAEIDGLWVVPGSPYADDGAVLAALTEARGRQIPMLGTCGGLQYAVVEFVRSVLGQPATHAESDGVADDNVVTGLTCAVRGERRLVSPVPGTRFAGWVAEPFLGMHYCSYAPTTEVVDRLQAAGVVVGATAPDLGAEVLEFPGRRFAVATLFQPHIGASAGEPLHPVITAFVAAARHRARAVPG